VNTFRVVYAEFSQISEIIRSGLFLSELFKERKWDSLRRNEILIGGQCFFNFDSDSSKHNIKHYTSKRIHVIMEACILSKQNTQRFY